MTIEKVYLLFRKQSQSAKLRKLRKHGTWILRKNWRIWNYSDFAGGVVMSLVCIPKSPLPHPLLTPFVVSSYQSPTRSQICFCIWRGAQTFSLRCDTCVLNEFVHRTFLISQDIFSPSPSNILTKWWQSGVKDTSRRKTRPILVICGEHAAR